MGRHNLKWWCIGWSLPATFGFVLKGQINVHEKLLNQQNIWLRSRCTVTQTMYHLDTKFLWQFICQNDATCRTVQQDFSHCLRAHIKQSNQSQHQTEGMEGILFCQSWRKTERKLLTNSKVKGESEISYACLLLAAPSFLFIGCNSVFLPKRSRVDALWPSRSCCTRNHIILQYYHVD